MKPHLSFLSKFDFFGVLLLRVGAGALIAFEGFPRFIKGPSEWTEVGSAVALAGISSLHLFFGLASLIIQSFGGVLLIAGLFTRAWGLLLAVVMGFSIAGGIHGLDSTERILAEVQLGLVFLALAFVGPGRWSLDRKGV